MGHGLCKLDEARRLLGVRLERGLLDDAATAWVKRWSGNALNEPLPLPVDSERQTLLVWAGRNWHIEDVTVGETGTGWLALCMLLHLPVLRHFWRPALRAQRFAWLARALPYVWAIDPQPLKPGTVIAGLGITSWSALPALLQAGRKFDVISAVDGGASPVEAMSWPAVLTQANEQPVFLKERFPMPPEGRVRASWRKNEQGRIVADRIDPTQFSNTA